VALRRRSCTFPVRTPGHGTCSRSSTRRYTVIPSVADGPTVRTHGSRPVGINDLFTRCDAVLLSAPLTQETIGMVGAEQLARLPAHAVLVNVGRGSVIDEDAVATALDRGSLGACGADLFAFEDRARPERPQGSPRRCARRNAPSSPHTWAAPRPPPAVPLSGAPPKASSRSWPRTETVDTGNAKYGALSTRSLTGDLGGSDSGARQHGVLAEHAGCRLARWRRQAVHHHPGPPTRPARERTTR